MYCSHALRLVLTWLVIVALAGDAVAKRPIVAVFAIQTQRIRLSAETRSDLGDYLASFLISSGAFQVVPKDKVKQALRQQKKESYRLCYQQSCQIAIGQELSADKSLATQIMKIGNDCLVTVTLYDLKKATAERGANAEGKCSEEALKSAIKVVVAKLTTDSALPPPVQSAPPVLGRADRQGDSTRGAPARVIVTQNSIRIAEKIYFASAKAQIMKPSYAILQEVARVLKANPRLKKIRVAGHTDSRGSQEANRRLSQTRAESVCRFLIQEGVATGRLVAKGYGEDQPIASNRTARGRARNRRIEFAIIDGNAAKAAGPAGPARRDAGPR